LLEGFDLKPLAFARRLSGAAVAEDPLYSTLLLLIVGLGSFSLVMLEDALSSDVMLLAPT
jgi:hypothetical protein